MEADPIRAVNIINFDEITFLRLLKISFLYVLTLGIFLKRNMRIKKSIRVTMPAVRKPFLYPMYISKMDQPSIPVPEPIPAAALYKPI